MMDFIGRERGREGVMEEKIEWSIVNGINVQTLCVILKNSDEFICLYIFSGGLGQKLFGQCKMHE